MTSRRVEQLVDEGEKVAEQRGISPSHLGVHSLEILRISAMLGILPYFIDAKRRSDNSIEPPWYRRIRSETPNPLDYELSFRKKEFDEVLADTSGNSLRRVVGTLRLTSDIKRLFTIDEDNIGDPYHAHHKTPTYELLVKVLKANKTGLYARLRKNLPGVII